MLDEIKKLKNDDPKTISKKLLGGLALGAGLGALGYDVGPTTGMINGLIAGSVASPIETGFEAVTDQIPTNTTFGQELQNNWEDYIDLGIEYGAPMGAMTGAYIGIKGGMKEGPKFIDNVLDKFKNKSNKINESEVYLNETTFNKIIEINEGFFSNFFNFGSKKNNSQETKDIPDLSKRKLLGLGKDPINLNKNRQSQQPQSLTNQTKDIPDNQNTQTPYKPNIQNGVDLDRRKFLKRTAQGAGVLAGAAIANSAVGKAMNFGSNYINDEVLLNPVSNLKSSVNKTINNFKGHYDKVHNGSIFGQDDGLTTGIKLAGKFLGVNHKLSNVEKFINAINDPKAGFDIYKNNLDSAVHKFNILKDPINKMSMKDQFNLAKNAYLRS